MCLARASLRDCLQQAEQDHQAIGHFNISDFVALKAVFSAAQELKVPVIVGLSEGEREFLGSDRRFRSMFAPGVRLSRLLER